MQLSKQGHTLKHHEELHGGLDNRQDSLILCSIYPQNYLRLILLVPHDIVTNKGEFIKKKCQSMSWRLTFKPPPLIRFFSFCFFP